MELIQVGGRTELRGGLRHDDVRRGEEHRERGDDREQSEYDKAQSVDHHCRKLPVSGDVRGVVFLSQLVGDEPDLLQDQRQLVVGAQARMVRYQRLMQPTTISVVFVRSAIQHPTS